MESPTMSNSPMSLMGQGSCKPAYCTANPVPNIPENNQVQLIDYRGAKIAAFTVEGRELICLPQAFELFLKHLVGGLHTVYTKLKRLEISPVVCNVEQVRILRGLGAIQPGVNRCKLIAPNEFDVLYEDCTNSSARPGRPPKRSMNSPDESLSEGIKRGPFEHGHPRLSDLSSLPFRFPMHAEEKKLLHQAPPFPAGCYPPCPPPHAALGMLPFLPFANSPAAAFYHQSRLLHQHQQVQSAAAAASSHHRLPAALIAPHHSLSAPHPACLPPTAVTAVAPSSSAVAALSVATSCQQPPLYKTSSTAVAAGINGGFRLPEDLGKDGILGGLAHFLPRVAMATDQKRELEIMTTSFDKRMTTEMTCTSSEECPRNQMDNPLPSDSSDAEPMSPDQNGSESDGCPSSLEDDEDLLEGKTDVTNTVDSMTEQLVKSGGGGGGGGGVGGSSPPANLDSLVVNIENILRTVAENARVIERYHATTSYDFRNAMNAERKKVQMLKIQLTEERQRRGTFQKKWKRERRLRQKLEELMSSAQSHSTADASHSTSKDDSTSLETAEDLSMNSGRCEKIAVK